MAFTSYRIEVLDALKDCKNEICEGIGALVVAEAQTRTVVLSGNLRRSEVYEVMEGNKGVKVGVTANAPYGLFVEKGIGQTAQPFLEPALIASIPQIKDLVEEIYHQKIGDSND